MAIIAPSLLAADTFKLGAQIKEIEEAGAQRLHIDLMDGSYVPKINFGDQYIKEVRAHTDLELDIHIMAENPVHIIDDAIAVGGDIINFHPETVRQPYAIIQHIKNRGKKAGIVLDPSMNYHTYQELFEIVDQVLIMTVSPGFGGQEFLSSMLQKIKNVNKVKETNYHSFDIEVDGGINNLTGAKAKEAGANVLVSGSYIFKDDIKKAINSLK